VSVAEIAPQADTSYYY